MKRVREFVSRLRNMVLASRSDDDLEQELRSHLELAREDADRGTPASPELQARAVVLRC